MTRKSALLVVGLGLFALPASSQPAGSPTPPQARPPLPAQAAVQGSDAVSKENAALVERVLASIGGKETLPAQEVFQNVRTMGAIPAVRFLRIMQFGYARPLGVGCSHCHDVGGWAAETKRKEIARQMALLVQAINGEQLPKIRGLASERPTVNCTTCHRGQIKPALEIQSGS